MSEHLPECDDNWMHDESAEYPYCICPALHAYGDRINAQHLARDLDDIRFGREEGLREAWEAVNAIAPLYGEEDGCGMKDEALAAIDALRNKL